MRIERSNEVFASWDGKGTLTVGSAETLDADDSLAQMILHETCHALVEGPEGFSQPDWGVQIDNPEHRVHEYACLRLQAALTEKYGLRTFFAATTTFRKYYDQLPSEPLADTKDNAVALALPGWQRATTGPWAVDLHEALQATAEIAAIVKKLAPTDSLWSSA